MSQMESGPPPLDTMDEYIFSNEDLLKLIISSCCFAAPLESWCWTALVPGVSSSTKALGQRLLVARSLAPLHLVNSTWHACAAAILDEPCVSLDLSGVLSWPLGSCARRSLRTLLYSSTHASLPRVELPALTLLSLRGCTNARAETIESLCAPSMHLRKLDLSGCTRLGERALRGLRTLPLTHLDLEGVRLSPAMVEDAAQPLTLVWLNLAHCQLCPEGFNCFARAPAAPGLRSLGLEGLVGISHRYFAMGLWRLESLTELNLSASDLADGALIALSRVPNLTSLDLSDFDAHAHEGQATAVEAVILAMPALRHVNLLRCGGWLTHEALWRLHKARIAVRHDLLPPRRALCRTDAAAVDSWELLEATDFGELTLSEPPAPMLLPEGARADYARPTRQESIYHVSQGDEPLYGGRSRRSSAQVGEWRRQRVFHTDAHGLPC